MISLPIGILPCEHCGEPATARLHLRTELRSHEEHEGRAVPASVNEHRNWVFCSEECRHEWYSVPSEKRFATTAKETDRLFRLVAYHVAPGNVETLHDHQYFDTAEELHAYWRSEGPATPNTSGLVPGRKPYKAPEVVDLGKP